MAIFLPVLVEFIYVYSKGPPETENRANGQRRGVRSPSPGLRSAGRSGASV
jgi:hypothetical protein